VAPATSPLEFEMTNEPNLRHSNTVWTGEEFQLLTLNAPIKKHNFPKTVWSNTDR
jgi:hypothetical protein